MILLIIKMIVLFFLIVFTLRIPYNIVAWIKGIENVTYWSWFMPATLGALFYLLSNL